MSETYLPGRSPYPRHTCENEVWTVSQNPHVCPVCHGKGEVPIPGWHAYPPPTKPCHTCNGTGVVWG